VNVGKASGTCRRGREIWLQIGWGLTHR